MTDEVQITATTRWTRQSSRRGPEGWVQVEYFCFTKPDGGRSYAGFLSEEQLEIFTRQERERAALAAAPSIPAIEQHEAAA